jgi:putative transcriptional regulator
MTTGKGRVCNSIREYRLRAGLTQAELAERVGATRQTIIAIEAEKYSPSLELAFRIARAFGAPFEAVFDYKDGHR